MLQTSLLLMKSFNLIKPRLPFSVCYVFFVSKSKLLDFYGSTKPELIFFDLLMSFKVLLNECQTAQSRISRNVLRRVWSKFTLFSHACAGINLSGDL